MKTILFILSVTLLLCVLVTSCNSNGNTGNGANDPTSQYEPNNIQEPEDARLQSGGDTTNSATIDTTGTEK